MGIAKGKIIVFFFMLMCIVAASTSCADTDDTNTPIEVIPYEQLEWCDSTHIPAFEYDNQIFYSIGARSLSEIPAEFEPCGFLYVDHIEEEYEIVYSSAKKPDVVYVSDVDKTSFEPFTTVLGTKDLLYWNGELYIAADTSDGLPTELPDGFVESGKVVEVVHGIPNDHGQTNDIFSRDGIVYTCTDDRETLYVEGKVLKIFLKTNGG